jgi:hypothetical protein
MSKFLRSLTEVNIAPKFYRTFSIIVVIAAALTVISTMYISNMHINAERRKIYAINEEGQVFLMTRTEGKEKRSLEAEAHVRLMLGYLFDIDKYTYKEKAARAFDLGSNKREANGIYKYYKQQETSGWYREIEQYNARSSLRINSITCDTKESPYKVTASFVVIINSDMVKNKMYNLAMEIIVVEGVGERTAANPHNLLVENILTRDFSPIKN